MRWIASVVASLLAGGHVIVAPGVEVRAPGGWRPVRPAPAGAVTEPRTLLVAGTRGVAAKPSCSQIGSYRVPAVGAAVVVVGWSSRPAAGGTAPKPGLSPLQTLTAVRRHDIVCFPGRGTAVDLLLDGSAYQVNVLVGSRASPLVVEQALAVARSFTRRSQ